MCESNVKVMFFLAEEKAGRGMLYYSKLIGVVI